MKKEKERADHEIRRKRRNLKAKKSKERRKEMERGRREREEREIMHKNFPEMERNSDSDYEEDSYSDDSDSSAGAPTLEEQLRNFGKIAATGQLFLKYTGKRRRKPQDRIVKVSFDNKYRPKQISWGSGSRHIDFSEILYIAWGHYTPVFEARKDQLKKDLCFSVVGKQQILDVQAQSKEMAELWVKGLRKLIGMTDEESDRRAKEGLKSGNLPGHNRNKDVSESKRAEREHKKRTKSLMLLQQDLFVMTTTTVFRNLEEERIWDIDQGVRERFNAKSLYELALREDIPWRQWNHWVREKIVTYLRENNRIAHTPGYQNGYPQQPMYNQGYPPQQPNPGMYGQGYPPQQQPAQAPHHVQRNPSYAQLPPQQPYPPPQFQNIQNVQMPPMATNWPPQGQPMQGQPPQGQNGQQQGEECSLM